MIVYLIKDKNEHGLFSSKVLDFPLHVEPLLCYLTAHTHQCTHPPSGCLGGHMTAPQLSCNPRAGLESASLYAHYPLGRVPDSPSVFDI